jgi:hypothetical protein
VNNFIPIITKGFLVILALTLFGCSSVSEELKVNVSSDIIQAYKLLDKSEQVLDINEAKVNVLSDTEAKMVWFKMRMAANDQGDVRNEQQKVTLNWQLVNGNWKITSKKIKTKSEFNNILKKKPINPHKNRFGDDSKSHT